MMIRGTRYRTAEGDLATSDDYLAWAHGTAGLDVPDPDDLTHAVEFDLPFRVDDDGRVWLDQDETSTPEAYVTLDAEGQEVDGAETAWVDDLRSQGWEALAGYSGQHGYTGAHLHPSEQLGGGLARDVLATPGVYVVIPVNGLRDLDEDDYTDEMRDADYGYAWAILRQVGGAA